MLYSYVLTGPYVNMVLRFTVVSKDAFTTRKFIYDVRRNSLGITSLKRKRKERRFVDLRIILMLRCGNEFLKVH